ncbi:hypothetical protein Patl1_09383 [Pistacia atlantica]|uniref:Uncharacterized protein n=1 Tax=Pistacia atlantica TaxID=434234 RepID=A0ACC1AHT1_9ROSI|nr:hypothetical protein Patl1_09383 [Pistacia atlantica]
MGGELAATATMTKKKKKKGRPSLLDIQKRSLKQQQLDQRNQQQQQNPNSCKSDRRSTQQNPNSNYNDVDDDDERKEKKHKLLLGLDNSFNHQQQHYPISSPDFSGPNSILDGKRRKINSIHTGSDQTEEKVLKATDTLRGSPVDSGPTTPLPDKKLLVFVLDRLQKKDTYGVFSEPVDSEELPDYHEIIAHPMDFATLRKKLDGGSYTNLEQFEKDVFLICSNAMQYNSPDTIYFRQARTIQEMAKKDFENLRQDSDSEPQPQPKVVRRGRPPKSLKKSLDTSPSDRAACEVSSDATLANGGDNGNWSSAHNLRKGPMPSFKFRTADALNRASYGSHSLAGETYTSWLSEWENEFPASVVKAVLKYGKKQSTLDENKRDTYEDSLSSGHGPSVFTTFEGELKQLMVVGLNSEHGYARSLARFAADLGPVVWKIVSKKIESVLPVGVKVSPGWVGENKVNEQQQNLFAEKQKSSNNYMYGDRSSRLLSPTTSGSNSAIGNRYSMQVGEDMENNREVNSQNEPMFLGNTLGGLKPASRFQSQSRPVIHSGMNGFSGTAGFGFNSSPQVGTAGLGTEPGKSRFDNSSVPSGMLGVVRNGTHPIYSMPTNDHDSNLSNVADCSSSRHSEDSLVLGFGSRSHTAVDLGLQGESSWQELSTFNKQVFHPFPPDLNVRFLAPGSPISNIQISSQQQPDLALQL